MTEQKMFDIKFRIAWSFQLEKLNAILFRRLDKFILFTQFMLGTTVVTEYGSSLLLGVLVAVLAALQFVIKPGEVAGAGKSQAQCYSELLDDIDTGSIDANTAVQKIKAIEKKDSDIVMSLREPARNAACLMLGVAKDGNPSTFGRFLAWVCGVRDI